MSRLRSIWQGLTRLNVNLLRRRYFGKRSMTTLCVRFAGANFTSTVTGVCVYIHITFLTFLRFPRSCSKLFHRCVCTLMFLWCVGFVKCLERFLGFHGLRMIWAIVWLAFQWFLSFWFRLKVDFLSWVNLFWLLLGSLVIRCCLFLGTGLCF